jgi:hypothetical protein
MNATIETLLQLSDERFLAIYTSLAETGFGPLDGEVAKALKFRPQAIRKLPLEQRARAARKLLERTRNTDLAYELFGGYLIKQSRTLVTDFLDATGVEHQEGLVEDTEQGRPDPAKLQAAVSALDAKYPREDVTLYLAISTQTWPEVEQIAELWRGRSGGG